MDRITTLISQMDVDVGVTGNTKTEFLFKLHN